jgi:hypothetical protein
MADVELDITSQSLNFVAPGKYMLGVDLPVPVDNERANAKFNKKKGEVRIEMPVR